MSNANSLTLTYKLRGQSKVTRKVSSVEEAVMIWNTARDTEYFGASEVTKSPTVTNGKAVVAEIYYNGKVATK